MTLASARSSWGVYAVAPIQYRGVAMRHVGPRDATWVPLSISTWTASSALGLCAPDRGPSVKIQLIVSLMIYLYDQFSGRNRERLAGGAGGGNEHPCSPARCRRHPDRMSLQQLLRPRPASRGSPPLSGSEARLEHSSFDLTRSRISVL